jgi:hypothetical protein
MRLAVTAMMPPTMSGQAFDTTLAQRYAASVYRSTPV